MPHHNLIWAVGHNVAMQLEEFQRMVETVVPADIKVSEAAGKTMMITFMSDDCVWVFPTSELERKTGYKLLRIGKENDKPHNFYIELENTG